MHVDLARLDLDLLAAARLRVQRFAAALERRIDRRALQDPAGQSRQRGIDRGDVQRRHRPLAQQLAFGIVGIGHLPQPRHRVVGLARTQQAAGDLGRFAEAQRQQAGGQRIEAAGVATLLRAEQVPRPLQRLVGARPARLVEQQDAVELAELRAWTTLRHPWLPNHVGAAIAASDAAGRSHGCSYRAGVNPRRRYPANRAAGCRCARRGPRNRRSGSAARARGAGSPRAQAGSALPAPRP